MFITSIDFFPILADFLQVILEIGVVLGVTKPAHERVFLRYLDGHQGAGVEPLPEQCAKVVESLFALRCGRLEIRNTEDLGGNLPPWLITDLNEAG